MTRSLLQTPTQERLYHRALALCSCALLIIAQRASAHEAPADPPLFFEPECIEVVDASVQDTISIAYAVARDDVELTLGDIPLPDAKTHQFFAFRGAVFARGFGHELQPFEAAEPIALPLWITGDDIKRAAAASGGEMSAVLSAEQIPGDAVLQDHPALGGRFVRIQEDDARVPITLAQAHRGVQWDVSAVQPGVYTIVAYIFSPPYNGWAVRPGLVKIVASGEDAPAAVIESVHEVVFGYEGRRVRACVDAPAGTTLSGYYRLEESQDRGWMQWLAPRAVEGRDVELCFRNPMPSLSGTLRLRFDLESPQGVSSAFYSPDTFTSLSGEGACVQDEAICCATMPVAPERAPECCADAGSAPGPEVPRAGASPTAGEGASGCSAAGPVGRDGGAQAGLLVLVLLGARAACARAGRRRRVHDARGGCRGSAVRSSSR